jgi:mannose-1-phosphate guanylyltransferase
VKPGDRNLVSASGSFALNAKNNFVHAPGKFVALIGVSNLVIVGTQDALLVTTLDQSQDVGKVVKHLDEKKLRKLV